MRGLDIVRMIISAGRSHAFRNDMVRNDFPVISEQFAAKTHISFLAPPPCGPAVFFISAGDLRSRYPLG